MTSMTLSNFEDHLPPPPWSLYAQILPTLWPWRPISNELPLPPFPSLLQMIINQLKENINQGWLLYVIRFFLQVGFRFKYQLINLVWLSFDFFSSSWSLTIWFAMVLYSCVCSCQKYHEMSFIYNYSHL